MNKKMNQKGITLVALVITVILMLILVVVGYTFSREAIDKTRLEDIKTNMLLIQGKAKTIYERYSFKEIEELPGVEYTKGSNSAGTYNIENGLKINISEKDEGIYYIWETEDLSKYGLGSINVDNEEFYIIDYETGEVFYSLGYTVDGTTYYSLTELQSL